MNQLTYTEFEQGERQALLELRTFITKIKLRKFITNAVSVREIDDYAAQRIHDIMMDAQAREDKLQEPGDIVLDIRVTPFKPAEWTMTFELQDGSEEQIRSRAGMPFPLPRGAHRIVRIDAPIVAAK